MSNITAYPLQDGFETTLAQSWAGGTGTVYLNTAPSFTFPVGVKTYIVVNPGKTNMQVGEIDSLNVGAKTVNVSSISVGSGAGTTYTQESHSVGSTVIISDNYQFWKNIVDAVNSKVNTNNSTDVIANKYADATARDAAIPSPANGNTAYLTAEGYWTDYIAGAWVQRATGATPNASTTVAGKVEMATTAEVTAGTSVGGTGAFLVPTPANLATQAQSGTWLYFNSSTGSDTYTATMTPTLTAYTTGQMFVGKFTTANTGACTINLDGLGAKSIKTSGGNDLPDGTIKANSVNIFVYDGTNMVLQSGGGTTTKFGGTGADGAVDGTASVTITGSNNTYIVKNYSSRAAGSAARILTITPTGCILHIKVQGNMDLTNWTFNFAGKGTAGGAGGTTTGVAAGSGTATTQLLQLSSTGGTGGPSDNSVNMAGGGGAGCGANGATGSGGTGGAGGVTGLIYPLTVIKGRRAIEIGPGAGGGGGGGVSLSTVGGTGGAGGGCVIVEVLGDLTLDNGTTVITVAGSAGTNATVIGAANRGGGGGGGGGGGFYAMYHGTLTGTVTPTVTGGAGGTGVGSPSGGTGGAGGVGLSLIEADTVFS